MENHIIATEKSAEYNTALQAHSALIGREGGDHMKKSATLIRTCTDRSLRIGLVMILASLLCLVGAIGADAGTYTITSCGDCHTYPPTDAPTTRGVPTGAVIGNHAIHAAATPTGYNLACTKCHVNNGSSYTHRNGRIEMAVPINGDAGGAYSANANSRLQTNTGVPTGYCSNVYCHSQGAGATTQAGDTRTWSQPVTSMVWGTSYGCTTCHGFPPSYANGTTAWGSAKANMHASHPADCKLCHYATTQDNANIADKNKHTNKMYDIQAGPGVTIGSYVYNANGGRCSDISCHGGAGTTASWNVPGAVSCLTCHNTVQGARAAIVTDFSGSSHHVQNTSLTTGHCYACHWESTASGKTTTFHTGAPGGSVDLVNWSGGSTRPTATLVANIVSYYAASGRPEYSKLNTVCMGCHNDTNKNTAPFSGDSGTTAKYSWNGTSVAARYGNTNTASWSTYTAGATNGKNVLTKAYSAHGNAANNQRGWNAVVNSPAENWLNTSGTGNVLCIDCHNSHGSTAGAGNQRTSSYISAASNTYTGAMLKDVTVSQGGYTATYRPVSAGNSTTPYQAGAALCFDCHFETNATTTRPWGYAAYGSTQPIIEYEGKPYWYGAANQNPAGRQIRFAYKAANYTKGGHFKASSSLVNTPMGTIGGICTPCHDPHGVDASTGYCDISHSQYWTSAACTAAGGTWTNAPDHAVPLLKGTWVTSPYREDAGPQFTTNIKGGGRCFTGFSNTSIPGRHIDQNTFGQWSETITTGMYSATTVTIGLYNLSWSSVPTLSKVRENAPEFGGLCLRCHPQNSLTSTTSALASWFSTSRIHGAVKGWANQNSVNNAQNKTHAYTCSKCHSPHQTCLPRLMLTNCMDWNHRGRKTSGGVQPPYNYTSTTSGAGAGRFPGGGGGYGRSQSVRGWTGGTSGRYYFGTQENSKVSNSAVVPACHSAATGSTLNHRWNSKTPW